MPEHAQRFTAAPYDQFEDGDRVADWGGDELFTRMPRPRAVDDAPPPRFDRSAAAAAPLSDASFRDAARSVAPEPLAAGSVAPVPAAPGSAPRLSAAPTTAPAASALAAGAPDSASPPEAAALEPARPLRALALVEAPQDRRDPGAVEQRTGARDRRRSSQTAEQAMLERADRLGLALVEQAPGPGYRWDEHGFLIVPQPTGRKTSVITGHPGGTPQPRPLPIVRSERRRPSRTPAEWIGSRPERIVGWAFALGLILILIAITTADAATR